MLAPQREHIEELKLRQVTRPLHLVRDQGEALRGQVDTLEVAKIAQRAVQRFQDPIWFVFHGDSLEIGVHLHVRIRSVLRSEISGWLEFEIVLGQEVVNDDPDALPVDLPDLFVLVDVAIQAEHVEEDIDCEDGLSRGQVQTRLLLILLNLTAFEEARLHVDKIECFLELALLRQHFEVKPNELAVDFEIGLLHQLE